MSKYRVIGMHGDWKVMSGKEIVYQCRTREVARATARALSKKDTEVEANGPAVALGIEVRPRQNR
jgi:hypothetical protein